MTLEPFILEKTLLSAMPGVGGGRGITLGKRVPHRGIVDRACQAAVTNTLELAVPVARQPDFEVDFFLDDADDAAERLLRADGPIGEPLRHGREQRGGIDPDRIRRNLLDERDPRIGERGTLQLAAIRRRCGSQRCRSRSQYQ
jgi:hypothetical protein